MKVVFCWSMLSGYMASCWKAMARRPGVDLFILAHGKPDAGGGSAGFSPSLLEGLPHRLLDVHEARDAVLTENLVSEQRPDIVAFTGWWLRPYRNLMNSRRLRNTKFVMGVDSPWRHEGQFLTAIRYWRTLHRVDHVFVTGERSWQYVRRLGVPIARISRGMYGVDVQRWRDCLEARLGRPWPKRFLFMGRYAPEKAVDTLVEAYSRYHRLADDPWPLTCCGQGSLGGLLTVQPGVENRGFVQPSDLPKLIAECGAFVMPSRFDPWPLALVEAAAAGLPVVCTDACGSAVEVVRDAYNGFVVPTNSPNALAQAMADISSLHAQLPDWGRRSLELASCYSADLWADRWLRQLERLSEQSKAEAR